MGDLLRRITLYSSTRLYKAMNVFSTKNKLRISTLGCSVTLGSGASNYNKTWVYLLQKHLKTVFNQGVLCQNNGFGGHTITSLVPKTEMIITQQPSLVIIETCDINNYSQHNPLKNVFRDIKLIYGSISKELPNAKIVLMPSSPSPTHIKRGINNCGLYLVDYVQKTKEFCQENRWKYIDFWDEFNDEIISNGYTLEDCIADGIHPNDLGYKLWFEVVKKKFESAFVF